MRHAANTVPGHGLAAALSLAAAPLLAAALLLATVQVVIAQDATVERGDPAAGHAAALRIAGHYRYTFENQDVQEHTFRSTDKLDISPVGPASIHFAVELNFFNGHTCSLQGGALYRRSGSFVFDDDPANASPGQAACRLAIVPGAHDVTLKDMGGACKMYCGERGSLDGASFPFKQRSGVAKGRPAPKQ